MVKNPLVSVVLPVYNVEKYLSQCLDSLINQTYRNIEIIAVNDGSKDGSLQILKDYEVRDRRIIVIDQQNGGLSAARNAGYDKSSGEYVFYIDSDDWVSLDFIEALVDTAKESKADVILGHEVMHYVSGDKKWASAFFGNFASGVFPADRKNMQRTSIVAWGRLFKKVFLERIGVHFPEGYLHEDDYYFHIIWPHLDSIAVADHGIYWYRKHAESITAVDIFKHENNLGLLEVFKRIVLNWKKHGFYGKYVLPTHMLVISFEKDADRVGMFMRAKELAAELGLTYQDMGYDAAEDFYGSKNYNTYVWRRRLSKCKSFFKKLGSNFFKLRVGVKTRLVILGLTIFSYRRGEPFVLFGYRF
mgnify:CR=1 FL=1